MGGKGAEGLEGGVIWMCSCNRALGRKSSSLKRVMRTVPVFGVEPSRNKIGGVYIT